MDQEESRAFQKETGHAKQLPLPFQQRFLLDENTASKQLKESLLARDAYVLTLDDFDLLRTAALDRTVSDIGTTQDAWIVTRDRKFAFDVIKEGGTASYIALVSEESTRSSVNSTELSTLLTRECKPVFTYSATETPETIKIMDLSAHELSTFELPFPPDRMIELFDLLDKKTRIDTRKLAEEWTCSPARARQIARRLSLNGWLMVIKTGRENRYYPGPKYFQLRNMLIKSSVD